MRFSIFKNLWDFKIISLLRGNFQNLLILKITSLQFRDLKICEIFKDAKDVILLKTILKIYEIFNL
ncbi:MAG: hypothetical protein CVT88_07745 [Candidatus Altiarchaeales archaeon HGW-Altiarchaeales-1]|nr:MAG: hypothetical protein CVT88_07745 [Candidatus Altiarchaeales archaeon HGW-Altiarchaeales-1]